MPRRNLCSAEKREIADFAEETRTAAEQEKRFCFRVRLYPAKFRDFATLDLADMLKKGDPASGGRQ